MFSIRQSGPGSVSSFPRQSRALAPSSPQRINATGVEELASHTGITHILFTSPLIRAMAQEIGQARRGARNSPYIIFSRIPCGMRGSSTQALAESQFGDHFGARKPSVRIAAMCSDSLRSL
jgi:hypothetical protein